MNIDFRYRSTQIDNGKVLASINIDLFPIEIDDFFYRLLSITIGSYRLLLILLIDNNRSNIFSVTSISFFVPPALSELHFKISLSSFTLSFWISSRVDYKIYERASKTAAISLCLCFAGQREPLWFARLLFQDGAGNCKKEAIQGVFQVSLN